MAYGDTNNTSQSIGGGASIETPDVIAKLGVNDKAWYAFCTNVLPPFVKQHGRLPTMAELNSLVTAGR